MIEEIPESSWAAVEISTNHMDSTIFDFSDIADAHETALQASESSGVILFDSGCSSHMTPLANTLRNTWNVPT